MRLIISPWEYRHLRAWARVRIASGALGRSWRGYARLRWERLDDVRLDAGVLGVGGDELGVRRLGAHYHGPVSGHRVPGGVVHELPADLRTALTANATALDAWKDITPLARNEFICWVEDAKQETTRERRIRRTQEELKEGQRRPCCWPGCKHRDRSG
jgi:hypothetical protein